ncbi:MAG: hypothetical protein WBH21_16575 [Vibrio anguillarum]
MKTTASDIVLGVAGSIGVGQSISNTTITENPETDLIFKIIIPVVTGVLIPFLNDLRKEVIENMRARRESKLKDKNEGNKKN